MAVILSVSGDREYVDLTQFPLVERVRKLHEIVGGSLEAIPIGGGQFVLYWEDAKAMDLPTNLPATLLARSFLQEDDYIAGIAVQTSQRELDATP